VWQKSRSTGWNNVKYTDIRYTQNWLIEWFCVIFTSIDIVLYFKFLKCCFWKQKMAIYPLSGMTTSALNTQIAKSYPVHLPFTSSNLDYTLKDFRLCLCGCRIMPFDLFNTVTSAVITVICADYRLGCIWSLHKHTLRSVNQYYHADLRVFPTY